MAKKVPLGRVGNHQELANLAAYLVSDFSAYINGEVIVIDGENGSEGAGEFNILEAIPRLLGPIGTDDQGEEEGLAVVRW